MQRLSSMFVCLHLIVIFCVICCIESLDSESDIQRAKRSVPQVAIDFDSRYQHKSVNSIDEPSLSDVSKTVLSRVKRGSSYKVKTKVKYKGHGGVSYKTKVTHKTKIKIGGGGTGAAFGAGLIVGGALGAGTVYYAGRYGKNSFKRNGHELVIIQTIPVKNFTFNSTHGHYHNIHGEYLGSDGVYHDHTSHQVMRDAREHIPAPIVQYVESDHKRQRPMIRDGQLMVPMFRYYPFNVTHGIWEYSATSISVVMAARGSSGHIQPNLTLVVFIISIISAAVFNTRSLPL